MSKLAHLLDDDIETGTLRLKLSRALRSLAEDENSSHGDMRQHALHVSDFTKSDKNFCARWLVVRYLKGDERKFRGPSWVQYDGKERERKWLKLFKRAGILVDYQAELHMGPLQGHPDFIINIFHDERIVELTGHDGRHPEKVLWMRIAQKRMQCLIYMWMRKVHAKSWVLVEDKGNQEFKLIDVEWDPKKLKPIARRIHQVSRVAQRLEVLRSEGASPAYMAKILRMVPACGRPRCPLCGGE